MGCFSQHQERMAALKKSSKGHRRAETVAQLAESLSSMHEALRSVHSTPYPGHDGTHL